LLCNFLNLIYHNTKPNAISTTNSNATLYEMLPCLYSVCKLLISLHVFMYTSMQFTCFHPVCMLPCSLHASLHATVLANSFTVVNYTCKICFNIAFRFAQCDGTGQAIPPEDFCSQHHRSFRARITKVSLIKRCSDGATTFSITTFSLITLSIMTLSITIGKCNTQRKDTQRKDTQHNDISCLVLISLLSFKLCVAFYAECHYR